MATIKAELSKDVLLEMNLDEAITFVAGDSATGKTFILDSLDVWSTHPKIAKINGVEISGIDPDQVIVCKQHNEIPYKLKNSDGKLKNLDSKLILIDRYDSCTDEQKEIIWDAMSTHRGIYILMSRFPDIPQNYGYSKDSFKEIKESKVIINGQEKILLSI